MNRLLLCLLTFLLAGAAGAQAPAKAKAKPALPKRAPLFIGKGTAAWLPRANLLPNADTIEAQAQKMSSRLRNMDPFGLSTFPREDDSPFVEDDLYRVTPRVTLNQALQTLKINGVNLHRKEFLIGGRQAGEGDVVELAFKGEVFQAQVLEVTASQLLFRDIQRDETGVLKHALIPQLAMEPLRKIASQFESRMTPLEPAPPARQ